MRLNEDDAKRLLKRMEVTHGVNHPSTIKLREQLDPVAYELTKSEQAQLPVGKAKAALVRREEAREYAEKFVNRRGFLLSEIAGHNLPFQERDVKEDVVKELITMGFDTEDIVIVLKTTREFVNRMRKELLKRGEEERENGAGRESDL